jgi:hypothetical protein
MKKIARRVGDIRKSKFGALFEPTSPMSALTVVAAVHGDKLARSSCPAQAATAALAPSSAAFFKLIFRSVIHFSPSPRI